jgi:hypothetical protein
MKYIMVDKDFDMISVYPANEDSEDAVAKTFHRDHWKTVSDWEFAAERYAAIEAARIGAEWGCNY